MKTEHCRSCREKGLQTILSFGETPLSEVLLSEDQLDMPELKFPLALVLCPNCALVQLSITVPPELLYSGDYPYYSSVVDTLLQHFGTSARNLIDSRGLSPADLVVDIASNDGYMLKFFAEKGVQVLGIDPAKGPAAAAERAGVPTICDFFSLQLATRLRGEGRAAKVVLGNNVMNLVDDLNGFVRGVDQLLTDSGVAVMEVPYLRALIEQGAFDSIFHQNLSYFSLTSIERLFRRNSLYVTDVERVSTFGGSLRVFVEKSDHPSASVTALLREEQELGLASTAYYQDFASRVEATKNELRSLLLRLKREGNRIAVFGAAGGMATTLLSYVGINEEIVDFAVDSNPHKHGYFTAGSRLKILPPSEWMELRPDYTVLLAWNYTDEITSQYSGYVSAGGRFIIPIPNPVIRAN